MHVSFDYEFNSLIEPVNQKSIAAHVYSTDQKKLLHYILIDNKTEYNYPSFYDWT